MRKFIYINVPEKPDVSAFVRLDRPGITYINASCKNKKGITQIVPALTRCETAPPPKNQ